MEDVITEIPVQPVVDRFNRPSTSSSISPASHGSELEKQPSRASLRLAGIEEEEEKERREKVYVGVGKNVEKSLNLILWTVRNFRSSEICLVHVHHPSSVIPTLLGNLPATRANPEVVANHRKEEREKMNELLQNYLDICNNATVKASFIFTEAEHVHTGLVELVFNHYIQKLVIGSVSENCVRVSSSKAAKITPEFCELLFIYKGKHVWTRKAFEVAKRPLDCQEETLSPRLRSKSYRHKKCERLYNSDHLRFSSSCLNMQRSDTEEWIQNGRPKDYVLSSSSDLASSTSSERGVFSDLDTKLEEESLHAQLLEVKIEVDKLKNEASSEVLKRENLEFEALQAMSKMKDIEQVHSREANLKMEAEEALRSLMHEQERFLGERLEVTGELQKTMRNVAVLDCRVQEANRRSGEVAGELKLIQVGIASLQLEKQRIWRQKVEADRWLERWRNGKQTGSTNRQGRGSILDDVPELFEFSQLDLQTATCNFSESFKICDRGFSSVYKGELLGRTVSIQRLHAHNIQAPSQFEKEVETLGKLRHPHLINLIGACPEAWSLVYDHVPDTLQYCLFQKHNILPWKIRARIISEISTALLFLHSSHPENIVHGNLQPENILLDSELHCKLCDFGISRLLSQDSLRCPSFGRYPESKGAFPYTDPEVLRAGELSPKSDVYSFGIVMLQLLTGLSAVGLVATVRRAVSSGKIASILDPSAGSWEPFVAEKLADMALKFCEPYSRDRLKLTPSLVKELQQLHLSQERTVPSFFLCPIVQDIMCDPQVAADGFTYEREAILEWLENCRETSPMTNLKLNHLHLTANHSLRLAIQEWLCKC